MCSETTEAEPMQLHALRVRFKIEASYHVKLFSELTLPQLRNAVELFNCAQKPQKPHQCYCTLCK